MFEYKMICTVTDLLYRFHDKNLSFIVKSGVHRSKVSGIFHSFIIDSGAKMWYNICVE